MSLIDGHLQDRAAALTPRPTRKRKRRIPRTMTRPDYEGYVCLGPCCCREAWQQWYVDDRGTIVSLIGTPAAALRMGARMQMWAIDRHNQRHLDGGISFGIYYTRGRGFWIGRNPSSTAHRTDADAVRHARNTFNLMREAVNYRPLEQP